jgi:hypothetical protein
MKRVARATTNRWKRRDRNVAARPKRLLMNRRKTSPLPNGPEAEGSAAC